MAQSIISTFIDENDKQAFDMFCSDAGLDASDAIALFVKAVLRERKIPFEIYKHEDPFFSPSNQAHLEKSLKELREGKGTIHELIEVEDE